uniref:Uncharacterized protein n=1 Tax=Rhipicephalus zambeziensis TaxID=60191 RepID=A0A224YGW7_9ACAR
MPRSAHSLRVRLQCSSGRTPLGDLLRKASRTTRLMQETSHRGGAGVFGCPSDSLYAPGTTAWLRTAFQTLGGALLVRASFVLAVRDTSWLWAAGFADCSQ